MTILQTIKDAQLTARKARDAETAKSLTTLIGEITSFAKGDGNREATDKDTIKFLTKFINNAKENQGFDSTRDAATAEIALLTPFLPAAKPQLTQEQLSAAIVAIIDTGATKMGDVMAALKAAFDGEYDPKAASAVVKAALA